LAELQGDATGASGIGRNHVHGAVLAGDLRLDDELPARRGLDADGLHRTLVTLRVLVLEAVPARVPELLAGRAVALGEDEPLRGRVRAVGEDVEDGAARAAAEGRIADEGVRASLLAADAGDLPARRIAGLLLHRQRLAQDGLINGERQARRTAERRGNRQELREASHVVLPRAGAAPESAATGSGGLSFGLTLCQAKCASVAVYPAARIVAAGIATVAPPRWPARCTIASRGDCRPISGRACARRRRPHRASR